MMGTLPSPIHPLQLPAIPLPNSSAGIPITPAPLPVPVPNQTSLPMMNPITYLAELQKLQSLQMPIFMPQTPPVPENNDPIINNSPVDPSFSCDMVIARYKEPLAWLTKYQNFPFRNIYIYNKYDADSKKSSKDLGCILGGKECIKVDLKNEGRCDHTYLYHIVHNYDTLADVTVFTKGSSDMWRETKRLKFTVKKVFETHNTVMSVEEVPTAIHIYAAGFSMDKYRSSHPLNYNGLANTETMTLKPASPRPFGKWFQARFPGINVFKAVFAGVFAVSKQHIHQHPISYYKNLIKELEGHPNPEVGHYFERSWLAVFYPIPDNCTYSAITHEAMAGGKARRKRRLRTTKRRRGQGRGRGRGRKRGTRKALGL